MYLLCTALRGPLQALSSISEGQNRAPPWERRLVSGLREWKSVKATLLCLVKAWSAESRLGASPRADARHPHLVRARTRGSDAADRHKITRLRGLR
ncbi:hypothetical protein NDU88_005696 [Pleurodeles waltl]|uniref:Secreted protein n=1 Tax=Pleurodeles waltl TaxID=8319 RepID=A0AAV7L1L7_PLEWA|nr:hypothetical protein NDU88_005696 [Pleurodeles waltl]